jgi:hypothetical protein
VTTTARELVLQDALDALGRKLPDVPLATGAWVQQPRELDASCQGGFVIGEPWVDREDEVHITVVRTIDRHRGRLDWRPVVHEIPVDSLDIGTLRRCLRGEVDTLIEGVAQCVVHARQHMALADSANERERIRTTRYVPWFGVMVELVRWVDHEAAEA